MSSFFFFLFLSKSVLKHFKKVKDFGRAVIGHTRWKNCSSIPRWTLFYATCFCIFQLRFLTNVIAIFHWYVGPALGYSRTFHPFFLLAFGTAQASVLRALTLHQPWPQVQSFLSRKFSLQLLKNFTYKHEILTQAHHLQVYGRTPVTPPLPRVFLELAPFLERLLVSLPDSIGKSFSLPKAGPQTEPQRSACMRGDHPVPRQDEVGTEHHGLL